MRRPAPRTERRNQLTPVTPVTPVTPITPVTPGRPAAPRLGRASSFTVWLGVTLIGVGLLVCNTADVGPGWFAGVGATIVATSYTWALCARTGGRPVVYSLLALAVGVGTLALDRDVARGGAAVGTAVLTGVLAVLSTVPAARFREVVREVGVACLVAVGGAFAVVGFEPRLSVDRFEYTTLGLGLLLTLALVWRLGAGLHGLGRRGLVIVVVGSAVLAVTIAYAETLRHYGSPGLVEAISDLTRWTRDTFGAVPRPLQFVLGVPALAWGVHMRARRRQGWWVCAYGAAATVSLANTLIRPRQSLLEAGLGDLYGVLLGLGLGYLVIRLDLTLTGPRGSRARRAEEARALRPEPRRTSALL